MNYFICFSFFVLFQFAARGQSLTYYIGSPGTKPDGGTPEYSTLKSACTFLNSSSISQNIIFYITSDLTETENAALGVNTNGYTVTFKPVNNTVKTITFSSQTSQIISGCFVIGTKSLSNYANMITTDNIVIDGSYNSDGGKHLIFRTASTAYFNNGPISVFGNSNNITVKNIVIDHLASFDAGSSKNYALSAYGYYYSTTSTSYIPDNITFENCTINATADNSAIGVAFDCNSLPKLFASDFIIKNCTINARYKGIYTRYLGSGEIRTNTLQVTNGNVSQSCYGIHSETVQSSLYITENQITSINTQSTGSSLNVCGIYVSGTSASFELINNFVTGFTVVSNNSANIYGIYCAGSSRVYYNTILMNNVTNSSSNYYGLNLISNTHYVYNNIIISEEDDYTNYCIYADGGTLNSDYNNFYRSGTINAKIGYRSGIRASLGVWQSLTGLDAHSVSISMSFPSSTDLHLSEGSIGNLNLTGTPIAGVTTDIDGETRNVTKPYMGADENLTNPLPVELNEFSYKLKGDDIVLCWSTATEINVNIFEVEKSVSSHDWIMLGEVPASGNSNSPKEYFYADENATSDRIMYRLKIVDNDGSVAYSKILVVENVPVYYKLDQNYPNPFNPETNIGYQIPVESKVSLKLFDILGNEVAELVNENKNAGYHSYMLSTQFYGLSSGVYTYVLSAGSFVAVRKMMVVK